MVYHDLQFAVANVNLKEIVHELFNYSASYQNYSAIVKREVEYQAMRLSHHPSLAIWDGTHCSCAHVLMCSRPPTQHSNSVDADKTLQVGPPCYFGGIAVLSLVWPRIL